MIVKRVMYSRNAPVESNAEQYRTEYSTVSRHGTWEGRGRSGLLKIVLTDIPDKKLPSLYNTYVM